MDLAPLTYKDYAYTMLLQLYRKSSDENVRNFLRVTSIEVEDNSNNRTFDSEICLFQEVTTDHSIPKCLSFKRSFFSYTWSGVI